jgi:hypothetical protein
MEWVTCLNAWYLIGNNKHIFEVSGPCSALHAGVHKYAQPLASGRMHDYWAGLLLAVMFFCSVVDFPSSCASLETTGMGFAAGIKRSLCKINNVPS